MEAGGQRLSHFGTVRVIGTRPVRGAIAFILVTMAPRLLVAETAEAPAGVFRSRGTSGWPHRAHQEDRAILQNSGSAALWSFSS